MNLSMNNPSSGSPQSPANQPQEPSEQTVNPPKSSTETTIQEEATSQTAAIADSVEETSLEPQRQHPIPPPSEPMQYRAIGLVRGQYMPSTEQFTQGTLLAEDNTLIDAVLLGRVMSLVKNHLNLSESHLWVVYPRTRKEDDKLHVQIVGVWEPEHLKPNPPDQISDASSTQETDSEGSGVTDGYFSIRGEAVYQSREEEQLIIKIRQAPRKELDKPKFFKLKLRGSLGDRMVGHFWDLHVHRQGDDLVIQNGDDIGLLPSKKGKKPFGGKRPGSKKPFLSKRGGDKPTPGTPPIRREPLPKPIKRQGPPS